MKLTPLPTDKHVDPILQVALPMGFVSSLHMAINISSLIDNERLQGAFVALSAAGLAILFFKAYKVAQR